MRRYIKAASPDAWIEIQLRATKALLQFCVEHECPDERQLRIAACCEALQNGEIVEAVAEYKDLPLGGNGCFNEWMPRGRYEAESDDYAVAVFQALLERWSRLMQLSEKALNA